MRPRFAGDLPFLQSFGSGTVRVDKLANRVSFSRQLFAVTVLSASVSNGEDDPTTSLNFQPSAAAIPVEGGESNFWQRRLARRRDDAVERVGPGFSGLAQGPTGAIPEPLPLNDPTAEGLVGGGGGPEVGVLTAPAMLVGAEPVPGMAPPTTAPPTDGDAQAGGGDAVPGMAPPTTAPPTDGEEVEPAMAPPGLAAVPSLAPPLIAPSDQEYTMKNALNNPLSAMGSAHLQSSMQRERNSLQPSNGGGANYVVDPRAAEKAAENMGVAAMEGSRWQSKGTKKGNRQWKDFPVEVQVLLQEAVAKGEKTPDISFPDGGRIYTFDFARNLHYPLGKELLQRKEIRCVPANFVDPNAPPPRSNVSDMNSMGGGGGGGGGGAGGRSDDGPGAAYGLSNPVFGRRKDYQEAFGKEKPAVEISQALTRSLFHTGPSIKGLCDTLCINQRTGRPFHEATDFAPDLNASQQAAATAAVSRRLTLVQGPPGTGKTKVAVRIISYWVRSRVHGSGSILATSDSNIAVDNLLEGLVEQRLNVIRLGRPERSRPEMLRYCLDEMLAHIKSPQEKALTTKRLIDSADVICTTCVGAGAGNLTKRVFAAVLIDEASQATEIATCVPIACGCQQLVLVGDHHQLPPTITSDCAKSEGQELSMFKRLVDAGVEPLILDTQYRMHPGISQFPSDCFYGGRISDGIGPGTRPAPPGIEWPRRDFPVVFIPAPYGSESTVGTSKYNKVEIDIVVDLANHCVQAGIPIAQVGILAPYSSQVRPIKQKLGRQGLGALECASVDGFQGREKTIMLMSCVRSNGFAKTGFLSDWRRANVALTRARNGVVVVGNEMTLRSDKRTWGPWIDFCYAKGIVYGQKSTGVYNVAKTRALAENGQRPLDAAERAQAIADGLPVDEGSADTDAEDDDAANEAEYRRQLAADPTVGSASNPSEAEREYRRQLAEEAAGDSAKKKKKKKKKTPIVEHKKLTSLFTTPGDRATSTPPMKEGDVLTLLSESTTGWLDIMNAAGLRGYVWKEWVAGYNDPDPDGSLAAEAAAKAVREAEVNAVQAELDAAKRAAGGSVANLKFAEDALAAVAADTETSSAVATAAAAAVEKAKVIADERQRVIDASAAKLAKAKQDLKEKGEREAAQKAAAENAARKSAEDAATAKKIAEAAAKTVSNVAAIAALPA